MKSIEQALKSLGLGFFRLFFGNEKLLAIPEALKNPKRILVVRADARLGNLVFCLPFLSALRKKFPAAEVGFLVSARFADLLKNEPGIEVLTFNKKKALNPVYFLDLMSHLQTNRFDWCFDLSSPESPSFTNSFLCALAHVPVRFSFRQRYSEAFDNLLFEKGETETLYKLFLELLEKVAPVRVETGPLLHLTATEVMQTQAFFAGVRNPKAGLFLGGRGVRKWETAMWLEVAEQLEKRGFSVFVFYGPDETEQRAGLESQSEIRLVGPKPIREFAAILAGLDLFIASDTGPLHLASGLGVPVVGLYFTPDLPERYTPPGERRALLFSEKNQLTPERVVETAFELLGMPAQPSTPANLSREAVS